jgi:tetratricopeptide (TPR) repeat protein
MLRHSGFNFFETPIAKAKFDCEMKVKDQNTAYQIDGIAGAGNSKEALSLCLQNIKDGLADEDTYFIAARIAFHINDMQKAEQLVSSLLAIDPDHIHGWVLLGEIHKAQADTIRHEHSMKMAEELFPSAKESGLLNLTPAKTVIVNEDSGQAQTEKGKGISPDDSSFETVTFAEICISQGYFNKALKILKDLSARDPENRDLIRRIDDLERKMDRKPGT